MSAKHPTPAEALATAILNRAGTGLGHYTEAARKHIVAAAQVEIDKRLELIGQLDANKIIVMALAKTLSDQVAKARAAADLPQLAKEPTQ